MKSTRSSLSCDRGFTIVELLVASVLGLIVLSLTLGSATANRNVYGRDTARTRLNQNLRGALEFIAMDVRIAGENLDKQFPAIEIKNGTAGNSDELTVRRNLLDEILPSCTNIVADSTIADVVFADSAGCASVYSGQEHNFKTWRDLRIAKDGEVEAYIFNFATKKGEFFTYDAESDDSGTGAYSIHRKEGNWIYDYPPTATKIYILEEWTYKVNNEKTLQVVQNRDTSQPMNVSFGITNFQVKALLNTGVTKLTFLPTDVWTLITKLQIAISGEDRFGGSPLERTLSGSFFPRNILSN